MRMQLGNEWIPAFKAFRADLLRLLELPWGEIPAYNKLPFYEKARRVDKKTYGVKMYRDDPNNMDAVHIEVEHLKQDARLELHWYVDSTCSFVLDPSADMFKKAPAARKLVEAFMLLMAHKTLPEIKGGRLAI